MAQMLMPMWDDLGGRISGPFAFRLILQPMVAAILAIRAGWKDAQTGRPAFGWAILTDPSHRRELLRAGWGDLARLFVMAVLVDLVYEITVFRWIYPIQSLIVAATVAVPPYLLIRGPFNRLVGWGQWRLERPVLYDRPPEVKAGARRLDEIGS
jgi:hypothetical protein